MDFEPYKALYIHVPFCQKRCLYCDFDTRACAADDSCLDSYTEQIIKDIRAASRKDLLGLLETVYIGGGTPTFLGNARLSNILYTLSLSMHLTPEVECTLEANPESLTSAMVKDLFALGVTRISLGVQSFDDDVLKTLGRIHSTQKAKQAIAIARERFENVSIDLMCGIPGQTMESFAESIETALALGVKHISVYPLILEEGTPFSSMEAQGVFGFDEDTGAEMMEAAASMLERAGMHRYEVASYAYHGFESRHNQAYWTGKPYLGLGPGAVTMKQNCLERIRMKNGAVEECIDVFQYTAEDLMLGMRRSAGVSDDHLSQASILLPGALDVFETLESQGFVEHRNGAWVPTKRGWLFGNQMYSALLDLAP